MEQLSIVSLRLLCHLVLLFPIPPEKLLGLLVQHRRIHLLLRLMLLRVFQPIPHPLENVVVRVGHAAPL